MLMCDARIVSMVSRMLRAVAAAVVIIPKCSLLIVSMHVLRLKAAEPFVETSQHTYFTEKSGLRDVKRADFIQYWQRSGLKNPDKSNIFIKKNERNHSYHQFYPVLPKIRFNQGLLYFKLSR